MATVLVGHDEIGCMEVVELVDLEAAGQHRQVPFQQIDEDAFTRLEHGAERDMLARPVVAAHDDHHWLSPLVEETVQLKRIIRPRHNKKGGCQPPATSPKLIEPSNSARI